MPIRTMAMATIPMSQPVLLMEGGTATRRVGSVCDGVCVTLALCVVYPSWFSVSMTELSEALGSPPNKGPVFSFSAGACVAGL